MALNSGAVTKSACLALLSADPWTKAARKALRTWFSASG